MKKLLSIIFAAIFLSSSALAQNATSIQGVPILAPPAGQPSPAYQPCPNCAPLDGLVPTYQSAANGGLGAFVLNVPHIAGGPSALTAITSILPLNISLVGNQWNFIDTTPTLCTAPPLPGPYCYFRGGLASYPNGGYWNVTDGIATFAGKSGTIYYVGVFVGTYQEPHTGFTIQPDMINGGPAQNQYQYVGGGVGQATGPDNTIFQVHFSAHLIYCGANGASNSGSIGPVACEIRVAVFPQTPGGAFNAMLGAAGTPPAPGSVGSLPASGGMPAGYASHYYTGQERGL